MNASQFIWRRDQTSLWPCEIHRLVIVALPGLESHLEPRKQQSVCQSYEP